MQTPNAALTNITNFHAYFRSHTFLAHPVVNYGHRARSAYAVPKYLLWMDYGLRGFQKASTNELFFGGGRYIDTLGHHYRCIYEDKTYNDSSPLFPSTFALACNVDQRNEQTKRVVAFFRRLHQDNDCFMEDCHAVSCTLPLACGTRPIACLSFLRHITNYSFKINDIGAVEVKKGTTKPRLIRYDDKWHTWRWYLAIAYYWVEYLFQICHTTHPEPNIRSVTLPLPGFCSYRYKLYKGPPTSAQWGREDGFWGLVRAATPTTHPEALPHWEKQVLTYAEQSGRGPASPFTRLVEVILNLKDREVQLSFLKVAWLDKLLAWKMKTFGLKIYLTRTALPMIILFAVHLATGVLRTGGKRETSKPIRIMTIMLACIEALVSGYLLAVKIRQVYRIPRLFFRSIYNYIDGIAILLGVSTSIMTASHKGPPRAFLAFATLLIWIATVLMLRIYRPVGMLLLLLTETLQGVFPFLVLLFSVIIGT